MRKYLKPSRVAPERSRPGGSRGCDVGDDDKDEYARKLSQFNQTLPGGESTSMKFEWANLLADKSGKQGFSAENDNVGLGESTRRRDYDGDINDAVLPSVIRYHMGVRERAERGLYEEEEEEEEEKLGFIRTALEYPLSGLKDDYNVTCKGELIAESVGIEGHFGQTPAAAISQLGRNCVYGEEKGSENDLVYASLASVEDEYTVQRPVRSSIVDSIVDKFDGTCSSMRDDIRESRESEPNGGLHCRYLVMERDREYYGSRASHISRRSQSMEQGGEYSGSRSSLHEEYGSEVNLGGGRFQVESNEEGLRRLQGSNHETMYENEDESLKRGRVMDLKMIKRNRKHNLTLDWKSSYEIYDLNDVDEQWSNADFDGFSAVKNLRMRQTFEETLGQKRLPSPFYTMSMEEHSGEPVERSSIDIKKRLEHPARNANKRARQSSEPVKPSSLVVKKHLRTAQNGQSKCHGRNLDDFQEGADVHGDDSLDVKVKSLKTELSEHTEYFQQLVHNAFMKFVKVLYENTAQKIKLTQQRGTFTLKCSVCCRNSKEFVDILSLANHTFYSQKGLRAEHLGLHRALCVLMGWNYGASPNGAWVRRVLPYAEALALKQDLIIWPPVVFVHNTSIANTSPDERIIVSIEELASLIKGMGFGWAITKVCHGKAANKGVLVVNFHGTLSGLQEAERFHKLYAENKRGREELEHTTFQSHRRSEKTNNADKVKSVLYGYLGIAEDLDKLDFAALRRSFVKSRKEIQAIADTSFDCE